MLLAALPKIDGWKPEISLMDLDKIAQTRRAFEAREQQRAEEAPPPSNGLDTQVPAAEEPEAAQPKKKQRCSVPKTPLKADQDFAF